MKKIITLIACVVIVSSASAQFRQGRILAGGSLGFSATTDKYDYKTPNASGTSGHSTSFSLAPDIGFFIIDNLAVGGMLTTTISSSKDEGTNPTKNSGTLISVAPFARYYLPMGVFFMGQFGLGSLKDKTTYTSGTTTTTTTTKYSTFNFGLGAGYAYFLNDNVAIEPILSYQTNRFKETETKNAQSTGGIYFNVALQVYLGAR